MCTWVALSFEFKKRIRMNVRVRAYFIRQVAEVRGVEIDTWGRMSWWSSAVMRLNRCADCWRFAPCHRSETWNFVMVLQVPLLTKLQSKELFFVMNYFRTIFPQKWKFGKKFWCYISTNILEAFRITIKWRNFERWRAVLVISWV